LRWAAHEAHRTGVVEGVEPILILLEQRPEFGHLFTGQSDVLGDDVRAASSTVGAGFAVETD